MEQEGAFEIPHSHIEWLYDFSPWFLSVVLTREREVLDDPKQCLIWKQRRGAGGLVVCEVYVFVVRLLLQFRTAKVCS